MTLTAVPHSVELFAGGGGLALGMREVGFTHDSLVEWWAPAAKVLRHNAKLNSKLWTEDHVIEGDVRRITSQLGERGAVSLVAGGRHASRSHSREPTRATRTRAICFPLHWMSCGD